MGKKEECEFIISIIYSTTSWSLPLFEEALVVLYGQMVLMVPDEGLKGLLLSHRQLWTWEERENPVSAIALLHISPCPWWNHLLNQIYLTDYHPNKMHACHGTEINLLTMVIVSGRAVQIWTVSVRPELYHFPTSTGTHL